MKKLLSLICAAALLTGLLVVPVGAAEPVTLVAGGWYETLCAQFTGVMDEEIAAVSYTDADGVTTALTGDDFTYLVRDTADGVRIDIPGVKAGTYDLTVTLQNGDVYRANGITVSPYDRSGFAHKVHTTDETGNITGIADYTEGVGAYNDDGTLKENATVLYVTEGNKENVTLTVGDITITGIGNILNCKGFDQNLKAGGGNPNNDGKILAKMASAGRPLVVRIVGAVTQPQGVTAWGSKENGGSTDDNGGMCIMEYGGNITIEGVGPDATVDGWGFAFSADGTGRTMEKNNKRDGWGENIEVRNLTFRNVPEDCVGIMGAQDDEDGFKDSAEHVWVHNNSFYGPSGIKDASKDQDKGGGDGAVDFRNGEYMTLSYNYFEGYHKTSLIGGADGNLQYHITWHHNWWKNVQSRSPLCRQADVHIYNNLYEGQTSNCMSLRGNSYVFSEYNTFLNCANPVKLEQSIGSTVPVGACKSYMDTFTNCQGTNQAVKVESKTTPVDSTCAYPNFDTSATLSYIPTDGYALETDLSKAEADVRANAGVMNAAPSVPGYRVVEEGTLGELEWVYTDAGDVLLFGQVPTGQTVWVAAYENGRCVKVARAVDGAAELGAGAARGKLFLLDDNQAPQCAAAGWGWVEQ